MSWRPKIPFAEKNHRAQNLVVSYLPFQGGVFATPHLDLEVNYADS
jgi:hypothetical protein